jgi:hypothetical protein
MAERRERLNDLLRLARRGNAEALSITILTIRRFVELPFALHAIIKEALTDLLHIVSDIRNESERGNLRDVHK